MKAIEELYLDYFGNSDGLVRFIDPISRLDFFSAGWKIERLQIHCFLKRETGDDRAKYQQYILALEELRTRIYDILEERLVVDLFNEKFS